MNWPLFFLGLRFLTVHFIIGFLFLWLFLKIMDKLLDGGKRKLLESEKTTVFIFIFFWPVILSFLIVVVVAVVVLFLIALLFKFISDAFTVIGLLAGQIWIRSLCFFYSFLQPAVKAKEG